MTPFRSQAFQDRCAQCGGAASAVCARCQKPLCDRHMHRQEQRCANCERDFLARLGPDAARVYRYPWQRRALTELWTSRKKRAALFGALGGGVVAAYTLLRGLDLTFTLLLFAIFAAEVTSVFWPRRDPTFSHEIARARQRFLAEHNAPRASLPE